MSATPVFDWETTWKFLVRHKLRSQEQIVLGKSLMKAQPQKLIELSHRLPEQNSILLPCQTGEAANKIKPSESSRLKIFSNASKCTNCNELSAQYSNIAHCHSTVSIQYNLVGVNCFISEEFPLLWLNAADIKSRLSKKLAKKLSKRMETFRFLV